MTPDLAGRAVDDRATDNPVRIVQISPNNSLSPAGARIFFASLCLGTLLVSGSIAALGYWLVLPFAGAELVLLGFVLGYSMRRGRYREVVSVGADEIVIEKGLGRAEFREVFPRHWSRVCLEPARLRGYPSTLSIVCHGRHCLLGDCLTETERVSLASRLRELIEPVDVR